MTAHMSSLRIAGGLAVAASAALVLAGCTGGADQGGDADAPVSFRWTYSIAAEEETAYEALGEAYMELNPDVTIEFDPIPNDAYGQTLRTRLQGGNAADLILVAPGSGQAQGVIELAEAGFLEPITDETSLATVAAGSEDQFSVDGAVYAQPLENTVTALVVSEGALSDAGIEFPETFEDLIDACATVAGSGRSMIALAGAVPPNPGSMAMTVAATQVYAENPDWNARRTAGDVTFASSPEWKSVMDSIVEMNDAGCFQQGAAGAGFDAIASALASDSAVGGFVPARVAREMRDATDGGEYTVRFFPAPEGGTPFAFETAQYAVSLNAASEQKDAVTAFMAWLAEPEQAVEFAGFNETIPVVGGDPGNLPVQYAPIATLLADNDYPPVPNTQWSNAAVNDTLGSAVQGLLTGQLTPDQVLQRLDEAWDQ